MNIRQLEAFRAIMLTGSVTRAGEMLRISQPAASQLLQQLEVDCGFGLFHRRRNGLMPTPEATVLFEEVERMFDGVGRVSRVAASLKDGSWGALSLAAFPAFMRRFLPEIVVDYCAARPNIRVTLESRRSRSLIDWVATQQLDFGIGTLPSDRPDVTSRHLRRFAGVCVMLPDHPLATRDKLQASDLAGERFVSLGKEDRSRLMIDKVFDELQIPRQLQIEAPQSDTACALVARGAGISVVDPFSAYNAGDTVVARRLEPAVPFDVWLLTPSARQQLRLVDDFIAHVAACLDRFELLPPQLS